MAPRHRHDGSAFSVHPRTACSRSSQNDEGSTRRCFPVEHSAVPGVAFESEPFFSSTPTPARSRAVHEGAARSPRRRDEPVRDRSKTQFPSHRCRKGRGKLHALLVGVGGEWSVAIASMVPSARAARARDRSDSSRSGGFSSRWCRSPYGEVVRASDRRDLQVTRTPRLRRADYRRAPREVSDVTVLPVYSAAGCPAAPSRLRDHRPSGQPSAWQPRLVHDATATSVGSAQWSRRVDRRCV